MSLFNTISLIGMPGAGKSSVGVLLAKLSGLRFIDTDLDIQVRERASLQEIVDSQGHQYLRRVEEQVLLDIDIDQALVSTGGSVVYSPAVMQRLRAHGPVVYLECDLATLEARVAAAPPRGIASAAGHTLADVYAERTPLYQRNADHTVSACAGTPEQVALTIMARLSP